MDTSGLRGHWEGANTYSSMREDLQRPAEIPSGGLPQLKLTAGNSIPLATDHQAAGQRHLRQAAPPRLLIYPHVPAVIIPVLSLRHSPKHAFARDTSRNGAQLTAIMPPCYTHLQAGACILAKSTLVPQCTSTALDYNPRASLPPMQPHPPVSAPLLGSI